MEIKSKFLGEQRVDPDTIIVFPKGIPGFEDQTRFKLFHQEDNPIIFWLQSVDDEDLTFSAANPVDFNINYSFILTDEEQALLELSNPDELAVLILLHTDENDEESGKPTIKGSIKSPILINVNSRKGIQKVLVQVEQIITLTEKNHEIDFSEA
ncbi:flagellar assembly protein FliW [Methylotuvimicrobium buryatense]|uniref:Flagellar assembly factor FliW n=1 Tax=Methylotuvimicrobium buryatense TaxID=95641 RepID=A0A4P9ULI2_METBY|nr:flagellar assembly protein FliW [Methylotuvimicrobium buryatense]QCW81380.1 flagellar biosynthesis protein FliW [Methylotuvimicrobium buryatense]